MMLSALAGYVLLERSLKQDINANAFDQLRMSSLSAWQMAWPRIIVAPAVAWVAFFLGWAAMLLGEKLADGTTLGDVAILSVLPFFAWGVVCLVLANALTVRQNRQQWNGSLVQVILLYIISIMWLGDFRDAIYEIDMLLPSHGVFDDVGYHLFIADDNIKMAVSLVIFALMASVFVWARMANVLHLKRVDIIYAVLAVCAPVCAWWSLAHIQAAAATAATIYGGLTLFSLATQGVAVSRFRLPVWVLTAPLGILATLMLQSFTSLLIWGQLIAFAAIVACCARLRLGVNSVTVALAAYLLGHIFYDLILL